MSTRTGALVPSMPPYSRIVPEHQNALQRCIDKLRAAMPITGLRNPKIGRPDNTWTYCGPFDWVCGFHPGQLWLAHQLTGDPIFSQAAQARRRVFKKIAATQAAQNHDLGFQFSLSCVADYLATGNSEARDLALKAAAILLTRFNPSGNYIQAWNARSPELVDRSVFVAGRVIADSMMNLALLNWAYEETGRADFRDIAEAHADTVLRHIVRPDWTSYHCFLFDPATGKPVGGKTHQGFADESCWSRGQAWLIHGFAQCYAYSGNPRWLEASQRLAAKAEELMEDKELMPWDYLLTPDAPQFPDSSAAAITACGVYMLANLASGDEAGRRRAFGDRLLAGLLKHCDLTRDPNAQGLLDKGASHVPEGLTQAMLPYGDYFFMEALMRSQGHDSFFW